MKELDYTDRIILSCLGENSRSTLSEIASKADCSIQTVRNRITFLENKLHLHHTIEPNFAKLGYTAEYFIKVNFREGIMPDTKMITDKINESPYIQFAALTKGDFDLFLWAIAPSREKYEVKLEAPLRVDLDKYFYDWSAHGLLVKRGGFLPIQNEIIDMLEVDETKKLLLKMLNRNSRMTITDIAKNMGISKPTAKYHILKLGDYIRRFTSFLVQPGNLFHAVRFFQVIGSDAEFRKYGPEVYNLYLGDNPHSVFNKTVYATVPDGGIDNFFLETYASLDDFNKHNEAFEKYNDVIIRKHSSAIITKVLKGVVPIRKLDLKKEIPFLLSVRENPDLDLSP